MNELPTNITELMKGGSRVPLLLRSIFGAVNASRFPMALFWGKEFNLFFNDNFLSNLVTAEKRDDLFGLPAKKALPEIWPLIRPDLEQAYSNGVAIDNEDRLMTVCRNGRPEERYWRCCFSPVFDDSRNPVGVLLVYTDTTDKIRTLEELKAKKEELEFAIEANQLGTFEYNPLTDKLSSNERLKEWFGLPGNSQIELFHAMNAIADHDRERVSAAINRVIEFSSGGIYDIEYNIVHPLSKKETMVHAKGRVWFNEERVAYSFNGTLEDISVRSKAVKEIKESEQRFQAAVQAVKGIVWTNNAKGEMEGEQPGWAELTGQAYEAYQGYGWSTAIHTDDVQPTIDAWHEALREGRIFQVEHRVKVRDGSWRNFSVRAIPLKDADGTIREWVGVHTDITEQKLSEAKIRESAERYDHLIHSSPSAIGILKTEELIISTANQAIIDIWGKGWEIMGKSYFKALPELAAQGYEAVFAQVYKTGIPFNAIETPVEILQEGKMQLKYYNFLLYPQRNIHKEIDGIGIIATEVTSQAVLNKQIKENEKRFRLLSNSIPQLIWTTDPAGSLNYVNQSFFDYSGLSAEQINKGGWLQLVHPDDLEISQKAWANSIKSGHEFLMEHRFRNSVGQYRWQLSRAVPQNDERGDIQMWVGTGTDIEEQKTFMTELEKQVRERTGELAENIAELAKMNKELQSFAYISSHDLQEPLRKIQTFASWIVEKEQHNLSVTGRDYFIRMQASALRMQTLIDDLLAYSRTRSGDRNFEATRIDIIVEEVKSDFKEELKQKNATIEASGLSEVHMIRFQFRQLLQNLVSNAIKFANPDRPLVIKIKNEIGKGHTFDNKKLSKDRDYCHIRFSDNGIGFEQQFSEKIFELFQRLHAKQDYNGTGIGLAIVKKIVENHDGFITATGELNTGAIFDIFIPVR